MSLANRGQYQLSVQGRELAEAMGSNLVLPRERAILDFIARDFSSVGTGKGGLRAATGLRRIGT